jgi:hypothetical protein
MKQKIVIILCILFGIFAMLPLAAWSGSPSGEGAFVLFDTPSYPFTLWIWEDGQGGELTVALAFRRGSEFPEVKPLPTDPPTLDDAVEIFLPDTAKKFTPFPGVPDTLKVSGDEVPVAVFEATEEDILDAYIEGDNVFLAETLVASGFVKAQWSGKAFRATSVHAIGPVFLIEGGEAILVATGHEVYEKGAFPPAVVFSKFKVELH